MWVRSRQYDLKTARKLANLRSEEVNESGAQHGDGNDIMAVAKQHGGIQCGVQPQRGSTKMHECKAPVAPCLSSDPDPVCVVGQLPTLPGMSQE